MNNIVKSFFLWTILFALTVNYIYPQVKYAYPATEKYPFRHLTTEDGLPTNWCYEVMKDSRGFIWITTRAGLCRYDGYNVKAFQYDPADSASISDNRITKVNCIVKDENGYIWVGTINGLNKFDPVTGKFTRYYHNPSLTGSISSSIITCLYIDRKGTIWIGTASDGGLNKFDKENSSFEAFVPGSGDSTMSPPIVQSLLEDRTGRFWAGTNRGLFLFDRMNETFIQVHVSDDYPEVKTPVYCKTIDEDLDGTIVIGTPQGFVFYDTISSCLQPYPALYHANLRMTNTDFLPGNFDNEFTHWVIMIVGLYGFHEETSYIARTRPDPEDPLSITGNSLKSIFRDESGMLWVPGEFGVNIMDPVRQKIKNYPAMPGNYDDPTCFFEDSQGYLWIGSDHIEKYDEDLNLINSFPFIVKNPGEINIVGATFSILEDYEKNIWIGNDKNGLFFLKKDGEELIPCNFSEQGITYIWTIYEDSQENLWIGTNSGLFYREKESIPKTYFHNEEEWGLLNRSIVVDITEDKDGNMWIATISKGLFFQPFDSIGTHTFTQLIHDPLDQNSISNNRVWALFEDNSGIFWAATEKGLNRRVNNENKFIRYYNKTDPASNFVYDLTGDRKGSLWLTTDGGLIRFTPDASDTGSLATGNYKQILPFDDIFPYRIYRNKAGHIFVGGKYNSGKGYYRFHPDSLYENRKIPPVVLTNLKVNNKPFEMDTLISMKKHVILKHSQNFFTLEYATLDYVDPSLNQYAHFLEGLEEDWIFTGNRRLANYTDISPGKYIFHAKGSNNDGVWNEEGISLAITILPPFWATWWAYLVYGLISLLSIYIVIRFYLNRVNLSHRLEIEQVEKEKIQELDSLKSQFFANISHEFRNPLTLILGPLEKVIASVSGELKNDLFIMQRNALRLQHLINELLSLSKLESGQMKLQATKLNLVKAVNGYVQSFESLAKQRNIELVFNSEDDEIEAYVDREKLEKILYNLLSNAFKYTPAEGRIEVSICDYESSVVSRQSSVKNVTSTEDWRLKTEDLQANCTVISISDTGPGIAPDHLAHIFDRFYQVDDSDSRLQEGSGIGLALAKELVELHHGKIEVESEVGVGTTFKIFLPIGKEHLKEEELNVSSQFPVPSSQPEVNLETLNRETETSELEPRTGNREPGTDKPLLLIVEDNTDLREYILGSLSLPYEFLEAENGEEGLKRALDALPDIVISDVMMPKMDGFELCRKLKEDERTSHIPVILLTAKAGMESKLEGLETGADDFITKPFNHDELEARIRNLLHQREQIRKSLLLELKKGDEELLLKLPVSGLNEMDRQFLARGIGVVEKHLSDTDLNIETFSREMALSRSQLHRKLHSLINLSSTEFIRTIRLNKAAAMLKQGTGTVSEIAFDVGFNTLAYFTRSFKEQFGETPSEYTEKF